MVKKPVIEWNGKIVFLVKSYSQNFRYIIFDNVSPKNNHTYNCSYIEAYRKAKTLAKKYGDGTQLWREDVKRKTNLEPMYLIGDRFYGESKVQLKR